MQLLLAYSYSLLPTAATASNQITFQSLHRVSTFSTRKGDYFDENFELVPQNLPTNLKLLQFPHGADAFGLTIVTASKRSLRPWQKKVSIVGPRNGHLEGTC